MPTSHDDDITEVRPRPALADAAPEYRSIMQGRGHAVVTAGNYIVHVGAGPADLGAIRALSRGTELLCAEHERIGFLTVLTEAAETRMPNELRAEVDAMVTRFSSRYGAAAIVFSVKGFAATAAHSLVTSINLSTQATHPNRVFTDVESALPWLREKFPAGTADEKTLRALVQRLSTELLNTANKDAAGLQASFTTAPKPQGSTVTAREVFERVTPVAPLRTVRRG